MMTFQAAGKVMRDPAFMRTEQVSIRRGVLLFLIHRPACPVKKS